MTIAVTAALLVAAVAVAVALLGALAKHPGVVLTAVSVAGALGLAALMATPLTAGAEQETFLAAAVAVVVLLLVALMRHPAVMLSTVSAVGVLLLVVRTARRLLSEREDLGFSLRGFQEHLPVLAAATTLLIASVALALVLRRQATLEARTAASASTSPSTATPGRPAR